MGRTSKQLRSQVLCGMYGREGAGDLSELWVEPAGLKASGGLTPELACKFIQHSIAAVNKYVEGNRYIGHMGPVGSWSQEDIDRLVLPTAGDMMVEMDEIDDDLAHNVLQQEIVEELNN